jgi:hypothetical protein
MKFSILSAIAAHLIVQSGALAQTAAQMPASGGIRTICAKTSPTSASPESAPIRAMLMTIDQQPLHVLERGFCQAWQQMNRETMMPNPYANARPGIQQPLTSNTSNSVNVGGWKLSIYAGHSFTSYFHSDIYLKSSRYDLHIQDYEWAERGSRKYFLPKTWKQPGNNPFQFIDEPTNAFSLCLEKSNHQFCLTAFHPKFHQADHQNKYMVGTIDGTAVNGVAPINKPFDGYDQVPGESELARNQNTHRQMSYEIGYGYRIPLVNSRYGNLSYIPSVGVGIMMGENLSIVVKEGEWWEFDEYQDRTRVQGFGGSVGNRIEYRTPKGNFGVYAENRIGYYQQQHGFMDGIQKYNLGYSSNRVGLVFTIKKRKK